MKKCFNCRDSVLRPRSFRAGASASFNNGFDMPFLVKKNDENEENSKDYNAKSFSASL